MELRIEELKCLLAHNFIIAINNHEYFIRLAKLFGCPINIRHSHRSFLVDHNFQLSFRNLMIIHILLQFLCSTIVRSIIDKNNMIVGVILLQNRVNVMFVTIHRYVIIAWDYNAECLLFKLGNIIFLFVICFLLFRHLRIY